MSVFDRLLAGIRAGRIEKPVIDAVVAQRVTDSVYVPPPPAVEVVRPSDWPVNPPGRLA